ncbi:MAG: lipid A export permease/ATP-binding protein MsbA [Candidatus Tectomicrobia bacterium]|uniref:Lipid A export permease/ATP-binding protein MsbA n=1 Tax=Tectimicrobiota bacterium TaxID=2528274 RepID=A0A932CQ79_UNCTE|nr:lipid A export permease/ATP-binding protein MsbA [Candidatus Tectomicrobia bacterium]
MEHYKRLLRFSYPYWKQLVVAILFTILASLITALSAWMVKPVLDDVFIRKDARMIQLLPIALVLLFFFKGIFNYYQAYLVRMVGQRVIRDLRVFLFKHLQGLSLSFFHRNPTGSLTSRMLMDISLLQQAVSQVVSELLRQAVTLVGLVGVALYRDWKLSLIALAVFPLIIFYTGKLGGRLRKISRRSQEKLADLTSLLQECLVGIKIIQAFGREDYALGRFQEKNQRFYQNTLKGVKADELSSPLMEFLGSIGVAGVIAYGGYAVIQGQSTPGTFFSFLVAITMMYGPIKKLSKVNNMIQQALAAAARVFEVLDLPPEIQEKAEAIALPEVSREIRFENLSFAYAAAGPTVLKEITLRIRKGEVVAIVGSSGVGKSTLVDLLPRFFNPTEGRITIDGVDIRDVTLSSLRTQIGMVSQDIFLFNDTLRNNILFGRPEATEEEMIAAAQAAYAHHFIQEMPQGYETVIGERGVRLSGGERQRIAIARALLKNPPILILDEATSSLDAESEYMVQKALDNLVKNRTTLVIAHRLSTIRQADMIVIMEGGRIVETGTHAQLLHGNGVYRKLYERQYRQEELADQRQPA